MFILKKLVASMVLPPFSLLLLILAGLLLMRHHPRSGRLLAFAALIALMLLNLPLIGIRLQRTSEASPPLPVAPQQTVHALAGAQAIVVLGGGSHPAAAEYGGDTVSRSTLERLRYAARLQRISGLPVLVSGGAPFGGRPEAQSMRETLMEDFGVPVRWIEDASRDTEQNAELSAQLLHREGIDRVALVTSAMHMARATAMFRRQNLAVIPAPTGFAADSPALIDDLLPKPSAQSDSHEALHEWLGRLWYAR